MIWIVHDPIFDKDGKLIGDEVLTSTYEEIIEDYYPWFSSEAYERNIVPTQDMCVDNFEVVHWAERLEI